MSPIGHIDPELHGLLDEIVTDPRSALRLTPRKALESWLFSDELVRPLPSATRAERHLLEAHREALAELLIQASRVAYWKTPSMGILVASPHGSRIPRVTEKQLERLIAVESQHNPELDASLGSLLGTSPLRAEMVLDLARASLALVPSDEARYAVAVALPESEPDSAIRILDALVMRQERKRNTELTWRILSTLGSRQASAKRLDSARDYYVRCRGMTEVAVIDEYCIANLSLYLGDSSSAREAARRIAADPRSSRYADEQRRTFTAFAVAQDRRALELAQRSFVQMAEVPPALMTAFEALR
ncbi:MAG: hypothetical protein ABL998_11155 [Planctomycetota bacterium]